MVLFAADGAAITVPHLLFLLSCAEGYFSCNLGLGPKTNGIAVFSLLFFSNDT